MSADELLPLPEPAMRIGVDYGDSVFNVRSETKSYYTAAQVNEQSRANVAHATAGLRAELDASVRSEERAWRDAEIAQAKVAGWERTMICVGLPRMFVPVDSLGPAAGEKVDIPALTPERLTSLLDRLQRAEAELAAEREDAARLQLIADEYLTVEPFDMPTGQGDADIGWRVYQYQGLDKKLLAEVFFDDIRGALDAAMQEQK